MPTMLLKNCILAAWAVFFVWLISFGQGHLARLLHPRLWWLVICGAGILLLFLIVNLRRPTVSQTEPSLWWRWPSLLILLVPLLYFSLMQQARFNGDTFARRILQTEAGMLEQEDIKGLPAPGEVSTDNESSEVSLSLLSTDPGPYLGKQVEVVCQALQDQRFPPELMICYRFRINCCAADAQPVFLLVKKTAGDPPVANDSWIRAKGLLSLQINGEIKIPLLTAESLAIEKEPAVPFVF